MIPVLNEFISKNGLTIFNTTDNVYGIGFELKPCDLESDDTDSFNHKLLSVIRALPTNALARIKMKISNSPFENLRSPRAKEAAEIGYIRKSCLFFIEIGNSGGLGLTFIKNLILKDNNHAIESLLEIKSILDQSGLTSTALEQNQLLQYFENTNSDWVKTHNSVFNGKEHIGLLRLKKPKADSISCNSLSQVLKQVGKPITIDVAFRKIDSGKTKLDLERRLKQTKSRTNDPTLEAMQEATVTLIQDSLSSGANIVEYEFLVSLVRNSPEELNRDLKHLEILFNNFAEFKIETFGSTPSWLATLPGNNIHVSLKELDSTFTSVLPVWHQGESAPVESNPRALAMLRQDNSLYHFDLFNPTYSVYNSLIIGTSGKGKSVLTGLISNALLSDSNISIIKLDVGGSHSKECELNGGYEFKFQLDKPSGINPFEIIKDSKISDSDKIGILSRFLTILILEQNEGFIAKSIRAQIEESVSKYIYISEFPSLNEFYNLVADFPRRNLLRRWVKGGVYENAFSTENTNDIQNSQNKLRYYNFSQIFQASDPEFAQAGIAAVLVQFNYESLKTQNSRIVLICDETPFFIKSCFDFFKFTTANVRKYGHAVILITQLSTDLVVNGDTGIIENSPQRFLFSVDGNVSDFSKRFQLNQENIDSIKALKSIPKIHSEVLIQTSDYTKVLKIKITKKEYWRLTSNKQDKEKLDTLMKQVPSLTLKEAIECISLA